MSSTLLEQLKQEPVSPLNNDCEEPSVSDDDVALDGTTLEQFDSKLDILHNDVNESKAEIASRLLEGLEQLEDLDEFIHGDLDEWIKNEPFSNWLEEKMLPMFEDMEPARCATLVPLKAEYQSTLVPDTESLLQEFETVFDAVEMTHGTLTPPQSPPYKPLLTTLEPLSAQAVYSFDAKPTLYQEKQLLTNVVFDFAQAAVPVPLMELPPATPSQTDVAHELAVVDELIRSRAEDLIQYPSSPCSNSSSSSSNFGDCSSDDPEWIPETVDDAPDFESVTKTNARAKRSKPYSRQPEEKKSRKKEQNKNAATRYRMKKKAEIEVILEEERQWTNTNDGLGGQVKDLQREIKYLKGLMRDLFKAKGLIN